MNSSMLEGRTAAGVADIQKDLNLAKQLKDSAQPRQSEAQGKKAETTQQNPEVSQNQPEQKNTNPPETVSRFQKLLKGVQETTTKITDAIVDIATRPLQKSIDQSLTGLGSPQQPNTETPTATAGMATKITETNLGPSKQNEVLANQTKTKQAETTPTNQSTEQPQTVNVDQTPINQATITSETSATQIAKDMGKAWQNIIDSRRSAEIQNAQSTATQQTNETTSPQHQQENNPVMPIPEQSVPVQSTVPDATPGQPLGEALPKQSTHATEQITQNTGEHTTSTPVQEQATPLDIQKAATTEQPTPAATTETTVQAAVEQAPPIQPTVEQAVQNSSPAETVQGQQQEQAVVHPEPAETTTSQTEQPIDARTSPTKNQSESTPTQNPDQATSSTEQKSEAEQQSSKTTEAAAETKAETAEIDQQYLDKLNKLFDPIIELYDTQNEQGQKSKLEQMKASLEQLADSSKLNAIKASEDEQNQLAPAFILLAGEMAQNNGIRTDYSPNQQRYQEASILLLESAQKLWPDTQGNQQSFEALLNAPAKNETVEGVLIEADSYKVIFKDKEVGQMSGDELRQAIDLSLYNMGHNLSELSLKDISDADKPKLLAITKNMSLLKSYQDTLPITQTTEQSATIPQAEQLKEGETPAPAMTVAPAEADLQDSETAETKQKIEELKQQQETVELSQDAIKDALKRKYPDIDEQQLAEQARLLYDKLTPPLPNTAEQTSSTQQEASSRPENQPAPENQAEKDNRTKIEATLNIGANLAKYGATPEQMNAIAAILANTEPTQTQEAATALSQGPDALINATNQAEQMLQQVRQEIATNPTAPDTARRQLTEKEQSRLLELFMEFLRILISVGGEGMKASILAGVPKIMEESAKPVATAS